jgi:hypothetical protein
MGTIRLCIVFLLIATCTSSGLARVPAVGALDYEIVEKVKKICDSLLKGKHINPRDPVLSRTFNASLGYPGEGPPKYNSVSIQQKTKIEEIQNTLTNPNCKTVWSRQYNITRKNPTMAELITLINRTNRKKDHSILYKNKTHSTVLQTKVS